MTAFDIAWDIVKESGPKLNVDYHDHEVDMRTLPIEGYQDFRFRRKHELPIAGNFPDFSIGFKGFPTYRVVGRKADPAGSNINLTELAHVMGQRDKDYVRPPPKPDTRSFASEGDMVEYPKVALTGEGEEYVIDDLARTGLHEAIHQAVHSSLRESDPIRYDWMGENNNPQGPYSVATEFAANLGMHHDRDRAWSKLMEHEAVQGNEDVEEIADRIFDRTYDPREGRGME
tara:strand:+ start:310 stop:999 length:690 start_codon:yes stop_codon:yes gene_type:complete